MTQHAGTLFIIGYMCSGKTTLGRALSHATGRRFVDLDEHVEQMAGMSVARIFAERGEAAFRALERQALEALETLADDADAPIVACGGGTPCHGDNMAWMNSHGTTVLLECGRERLMRRLCLGRHKRPLIAGLDDGQLMRYADEHARSRQQWYRMARHRFDSSYLEDAGEIACSVHKFINQILCDDDYK